MVSSVQVILQPWDDDKFCLSHDKDQVQLNSVWYDYLQVTFCNCVWSLSAKLAMHLLPLAFWVPL